MRVELSEDSLAVVLSPWQKALGLMGSIRVPRSAISGARVVEDPMGETSAAGVKVGLRIPRLYYIARTIQLDRAFVVRRGVPALAFTIGGEGRLREVLVSTPQAEHLARQLRAGTAPD